MERLTRRETGGVVLVGETVSDRQAAAGRALDRLAAYEETGYSPGQFETAMDAIKAHLWDVEQELKAYKDTGLETEEIKELCTDDVAKIAKLFRHMIEDGSIDHLLELLEAEKDGRLVVLPCKVGDTVYVVGTHRAIECFIDEAYLDDKKGLEYLVSFECDSDCDGCPFDSWRQDYSGEYSCDGEYGEGKIMGIDFGKTVFLTRQEAKEALRKEESSSGK